MIEQIIQNLKGQNAGAMVNLSRYLYVSGEYPSFRESVFTSVYSAQEQLDKMYHQYGDTIAIDAKIALGIDLDTYYLAILDLAGNEVPNLSYICEKLECPDGYIYNSGNSYHFYSSRLLGKYGKNNYYDWLGRALLLNDSRIGKEIVDTRSIGYALRRGYVSLRVTPDELRGLSKPYLTNTFKSVTIE